MRKKLCFLHCLLALECYLVCGLGHTQEKAEAAVPVVTNSPPEGNTTFLDGTTWCVAQPGVSQEDLQNALDWACGPGMADCSLVQVGGPCFEPDTLASHASYVFNSYYQMNGNSDIACNFGGTATLTNRDPGYGSCQYPVPRPVASSSPRLSNPSLRRGSAVLLGIFAVLELAQLLRECNAAAGASRVLVPELVNAHGWLLCIVSAVSILCSG